MNPQRIRPRPKGPPVPQPPLRPAYMQACRPSQNVPSHRKFMSNHVTFPLSSPGFGTQNQVSFQGSLDDFGIPHNLGMLRGASRRLGSQQPSGRVTVLPEFRRPEIPRSLEPSSSSQQSEANTSAYRLQHSQSVPLVYSGPGPSPIVRPGTADVTELIPRRPPVFPERRVREGRILPLSQPTPGMGRALSSQHHEELPPHSSAPLATQVSLQHQQPRALAPASTSSISPGSQKRKVPDTTEDAAANTKRPRNVTSQPVIKASKFEGMTKESKDAMTNERSSLKTVDAAVLLSVDVNKLFKMQMQDSQLFENSALDWLARRVVGDDALWEQVESFLGSI
ncbi:uncharacterized protein BCR38DRAFT_411231 [Pseudomassariella vexata]|uniref:Uncharacterized protein n=1 Tax=Pseudomassariella vexata TaxID=1141098 RepID=A0A1Y2DQ91_9PEZI|nr:uncharacterized protein BCR38DRAFT_411231 [Pseudomassariella vexata]ORY61349.1 hypothetical protein BCR38DRAFT_411231 [Pseudomassariella vexata]